MRRNEMVGSLLAALRIGGTVSAGFIGHKVASYLLNTVLFDRFLTPAVAEAAAEAAPTAEEAATAAEGIGEIASVARATMGGGAAALVGVLAVNKLISNQETKQLVAGGIVASFVHGVLVSVFETLAPDVAPMLSGDGTAARLSAMYGLGASIDPQYAPIDGMGEYFESGTAGVGAMGEYFESGTSGLGNYTANPDIYEAAAGYGEVYEAAAGYGQSNHIDPNSNLDHELTMMEAAAGVGVAPYEAAAGYGFGEYLTEGTAGFGAIDVVPSVSTEIPGGQLWAGARSVTAGQGENAMVPAGILQTAGGAGILG